MPDAEYVRRELDFTYYSTHMQSHMNDLLCLRRVRLGHRDGVQRSEILVRQKPARGYCGHPQRVGNTCRAVCVRRVGEESPNHRQKRERRVRQPGPHRQYQPVPIQGLLLRRRDWLVLSQRQILRPCGWSVSKSGWANK